MYLTVSHEMCQIIQWLRDSVEKNEAEAEKLNG